MEITYREGPSVLWKRAQNRPQWNATDRVIDQWLDTRQELLVNYHALAKRPPYQNSDLELQENLQAFCTVLMDYLSMGHFRVFEQFAAIQEIYKPTTQLDQKLLAQILNTTDALVTFNDKYVGMVSMDTLHLDLSSVGEQLANRLELEDQLMQQYIIATYTMSERNRPNPVLFSNYDPLPAA